MIANLRERIETLAESAARFADSRLGAPVLAAIAIAATFSLSVPVGPFLIAYCATVPRRWWLFASTANIATALAAVALTWALQAGIAPWIAEQLPGVAQSSDWIRLHEWVDAYGLAAMLAWLALPLPQAPFVVLISLLGIAPWQVFIAFVFGKGCKYAVTAWTAGKAIALTRTDAKG